MSQPKKFSLLYSLVLAVFFTGIGVAAALTYAKPDVPMTPKKNLVSQETMTEYTQGFNFFTSDKFLEVSRSLVSFAIAFPEEVEVVWLGYEPEKDEDRSEILVSHPQLQKLDWGYLSSGNIQLFQRTPTYDSIEEFVTAKVDPKRVRIDSILKKQFPDFNTYQITDFPFDLAGVDFILTSFKPITELNGVYYFEREINPEFVSQDAKQINWYTRASELDPEDRYLLSNISINYLQY